MEQVFKGKRLDRLNKPHNGLKLTTLDFVAAICGNSGLCAANNSARVIAAGSTGTKSLRFWRLVELHLDPNPWISLLSLTSSFCNDARSSTFLPKS